MLRSTLSPSIIPLTKKLSKVDNLSEKPPNNEVNGPQNHNGAIDCPHESRREPSLMMHDEDVKEIVPDKTGPRETSQRRDKKDSSLSCSFCNYAVIIGTVLGVAVLALSVGVGVGVGMNKNNCKYPKDHSKGLYSFTPVDIFRHFRSKWSRTCTVTNTNAYPSIPIH